MINPADNLKNLIDRSIESPRINELLSGIVSSALLGIIPGASGVFSEKTLKAFEKQFIETQIFVEHHSKTAALLLEPEADLKHHKEAILQLCNDILNYKNQLSSTSQGEDKNSAGEYEKDLRGVKCPLNFVKTKLFLDRISSGDLLRIFLDDGAPIENVPRSVRREGHTVVTRSRENDYWNVLIQKGDTQE